MYKEGKYAMVQGRHTGKWSFPKGHSNEGEKPVECMLREVAEETGIDELPELAATVKLGGEQGARMTASLVAKASSMRAKQLAEVEADANAATERMGLPMVLLFMGFLILLGYPAMQMISAGFGS